LKKGDEKKVETGNNPIKIKCHQKKNMSGFSPQFLLLERF